MALTLDSNSTVGSTLAFSSLTWSHTCAGSNRILLVGSAVRDTLAQLGNATITGITYNGVALTKIRRDETDVDAEFASELWYLIAPATGAHNIVITYTGVNTQGNAYAMSLNGAIQSSSAIAANAGNTGTATSFSTSITIPQDADQCWIVDVVYSRSTTLTKGSDQTTLYNGAIGTDDAGAMTYKKDRSIGAQTMDWSETNDGNDWSTSVVCIAPVPASFRIENVTTSPETTSVTSITLSHNVGSNASNGLLAVLSVGRDTGNTGDLVITGVTYNGVAMTKGRADLCTNTNAVSSEIWYLANPATGTHNVVVTYTGTIDRGVIQAISMYGAAQTGLPDASTGGQGASTSDSRNITTVANNAIVLDCIYEKDTVAAGLTQGAGEVLRKLVSVNAADDYTGFASKDVAAAGSTALSWTWVNGNDFAHSLVSFAPAAAATAIPNKIVSMLQAVNRANTY